MSRVVVAASAALVGVWVASWIIDLLREDTTDEEYQLFLERRESTTAQSS